MSLHYSYSFFGGLCESFHELFGRVGYFMAARTGDESIDHLFSTGDFIKKAYKSVRKLLKCSA